MFQNKSIGLIGGGQMCQAIFTGMLASNEIKPEQILITDHHAERLAQFSSQYGVRTALNDACNLGIDQIAAECDVIIFAIKPQHARSLLGEISSKFGKNQLIISIMGGITLEFLSEFFPKNPILRVMPNTPMLVRKGIAGIAANQNTSQKDREFGIALFELLGLAYLLPENLIDPLTSVSGCSPAFAYLFIEAMADGGVEKGLPRAMAIRLAAQALAGAAEMVLQTGKHPAELKDDVCSPSGGTIVGVHALERGGFRAAVMNAVVESCEKMTEVGKKV